MTDQNFVSHADAIKMFVSAGSSESTFRRKVKEHPIHSRLPKGRVRGAEYSLKDIQEAVAQLEKKDDQSKDEIGFTLHYVYISHKSFASNK